MKNFRIITPFNNIPVLIFVIVGDKCLVKHTKPRSSTLKEIDR